MNPLLAFLKPAPAEPAPPAAAPPEKEPPAPKPDASYSDIVQKLYKLSISGLPAPSGTAPAWTTREDQFNVLKAIEVLISRRRRILAEVTRKAENRIEPLSSRTKGQSDLHEQLKRESREMTDKISSAEERLALIKAQRQDLKRAQKAEMDELDRQILALQK